jgi:hypothetical protein
MRKNYRKIPTGIQGKLPQLGEVLVVAAIANISATQLANGDFSHVGLSLINGQPHIGHASIPEVTKGRYSRFNVVGQEIVRRDLPKYEKAITFQVPCFGDYSNMCDVTQHRMVYVRENLPPRNLTIGTEVLLTKSDGGCVAKFAINLSLNKNSLDFERDLLFSLNLLHESVRDANVFSELASTQDFLGSIHVNWEILPAGTREANIRLILSSFRNPDQDLKDRVQERYAFFETLNPRHLIRGNGGMDGYVGAEISDDLVIFENMKNGNALYMLFADWRQRSQLSKTELLDNGVEGTDYIRIIHFEGWEARVHEEVNSRKPN